MKRFRSVIHNRFLLVAHSLNIDSVNVSVPQGSVLYPTLLFLAPMILFLLLLLIFTGIPCTVHQWFPNFFNAILYDNFLLSRPEPKNYLHTNNTFFRKRIENSKNNNSVWITLWYDSNSADICVFYIISILCCVFRKKLLLMEPLQHAILRHSMKTLV